MHRLGAKFAFFLITVLATSLFLGQKFVYAQVGPNTEDWSMFRNDSVHSGFNSREASLKPPLKLKWQSGYGSGSPIVVGKTVYVKGGSRLYAFDKETGTTKWSTSFSGSSSWIHASPAYYEGILLVGNACGNCSFSAIDASNGNILWEIPLPKGAIDPVVVNGIAYFGSDDWFVRAVDIESGTLLWTSPKLNDGITAVPAVEAGKLYVGTWSGSFYALDISNGFIEWQTYTGGVMFSSPTVHEGKVYVGSGGHYVYALDANTGNEIWRFTEATDSVWSSPAIAYNRVYIQDLAGKVFALDVETGNMLWSYKTEAMPSTSRSSPAVANGTVYIGSYDGFIYGFDAVTGALLWQYRTGWETNSSPAVAYGVVYFTDRGGNVYAFENEEIEPAPPPTPPAAPWLNVPDLKQYLPPWKDDIYDDATKWTSSPTIERWGCALLSASMVLQYNGHLISPEQLNNWLKSQPDGYVRNGLLNWLVISRYTRIHDTEDSPTLLFKQYRANDIKLQEELDSGVPPILKLPGHFLVAKGEQNSDFVVNDPASTKVFLSQVEDQRGDYTAINSYVPTHTNLSSILLVSDGDTEIKIYNSQEELVQTVSYLQEPLIDNVENIPANTEDLRIVILQESTDGKQMDGNYTVQVIGNGGPFFLQAYLYDQLGNLIDDEIPFIEESAYGDNPINILLTYDENPETDTLKRQIDFDSTLQDLETLWLKGWIDDYGVYLGLRGKLIIAKFMQEIKIKPRVVQNVLTAFGNQLDAQRGKHVSEDAYETLFTDLEVLKTN